MKTLLLKIMKLLPLEALLPVIAEMALGTRLWELVRETVEEIEREMPNAPGETKFKQAFQRITFAAAGAAIDWTRGRVNLGIEIAVRLLKELFSGGPLKPV